MSEIDEYADPESFVEMEPCCPYGFEFCEDPETRDMNLCTTECRLYLESIEDE